MEKPTAPFSATYSPQIPELLLKLNYSLSISTYQAGKIVVISPRGEDALSILPRTFDKPMGFDVQGDRMIIATKDEVVYLENSQELAANYPNKKDTYDSLFVPKATYYTGQVDLHDIAFGKEGIFAINTSFSCLCEIGKGHNFIPRWQPKFITALVSEDRCHLNGLVMKDGYPRYVTALASTDTAQGWREHIVDGGQLIDLKTDEALFNTLAMPHSPRLYKGKLYCLLSATGQLVELDVVNKEIKVIKELNGFCRGMDIVEDYAFIGMSKLCKNSSTFAKLPFAETADTAGIKVIHIPTGAFVGEITFTSSVDEIYEVKALKGGRPNLLNTHNPIHKYSLTIPGNTFWANPDDAVFNPKKK